MTINILAIDTTNEACSVAIITKSKIFNKFKILHRKHTKYILPMINTCLNKVNLDLSELDLLAFCHGPGSYTGVRISVGIAQGLSLGACIPMVGISSLLTIAQGVYRKYNTKRILVAIDAKMKEIYFAAYELNQYGEWQKKNNEQLLNEQQLLYNINNLYGYWMIAGTGWLNYYNLIKNKYLLKSNVFLPNAIDILPLALNAWKKGKIIDVNKVHPVYLRQFN